MRISFIGTGRLASQLAIALAARHTIQHIYSRDLSKAQRLAEHKHRLSDADAAFNCQS